MRFLEKNLPDKASRLVQSMQHFSNLTHIQEMTFSTMYPTTGV
jgi:hypothetical protein